MTAVDLLRGYYRAACQCFIGCLGFLVDERGDLVQHNIVYSKMTAGILLQGGVLVVMLLFLDFSFFMLLRSSLFHTRYTVVFLVLSVMVQNVCR